MKNMARHIVTGTLMLLVLWAASCSHDTEVFGTSDKEPILSIGLRLPARSPVKAMKLVKRMKTT